MSESLFDKLNRIDVSDKTEKKGGFTYLSWSWAWGELKKHCSNAETVVYHDEETKLPYFSSDAGVYVKVGVIADGIEHISYLPVMNFKNKAMKLDQVDMMDINKTIQRCTVKAIALHGLGLYIYSGEDLPENATDSKPNVKKPESKSSKPSAARFKKNVAEKKPAEELW